MNFLFPFPIDRSSATLIVYQIKLALVLVLLWKMKCPFMKLIFLVLIAYDSLTFKQIYTFVYNVYNGG